ncbi:flavin reductase family protein [Streptomyces olivaceoviridis]|uniref:flavin reductase family protein n=1 Tax=Streptomyces olivaceoviridis TaxID=1921 RepID=UPI00339F5195
MSKVREIVRDPRAVRHAFAQFPSGVAVLAADDGLKHALVATSFMVGVSPEPCLGAVSVQKSSETWPRMKEAGPLGVSAFGKGQGNLTGRDRAARCDEVPVEVGAGGAVFLEDAALWLECWVARCLVPRATRARQAA